MTLREIIGFSNFYEEILRIKLTLNTQLTVQEKVEFLSLPLKKSACTDFSFAAKSIRRPVDPPAWKYKINWFKIRKKEEKFVNKKIF